MPDTPESQIVNENEESFSDILTHFEQGKTRKPQETDGGREATVVAVTADSVLVDIGFKTEGILLLSALQGRSQPVRVGDKLFVSIKGRDPEGYYQLALGKIARPRD